jgi:hypothetical protein
MGGKYSRHGGRRNAYTVHLQNFKVREQFGRTGSRCGYYIKRNDSEIGCRTVKQTERFQ